MRRIVLTAVVCLATCTSSGTSSGPKGSTIAPNDGNGKVGSANAKSAHGQWYDDATSACPPGTRLSGSPPPVGSEVWCERPNGERHGPFATWNARGTKSTEGAYADDRIHGIMRSFHSSGQTAAEQTYEHGVLTGPTSRWHRNGTLAEKGRLVAGEPDGPWLEFYENGNKRREGAYRTRARHGKWTLWHPGGKIDQVRTYDQGNLLDVVAYKDGKPSKEPAPLEPSGEFAIGIPACDEYMNKYLRCIDEKLPEAAKEQTRKAMKQAAEAWRQAAASSNPSQREAVERTCKTALDAVRKATTSMGCTW